MTHQTSVFMHYNPNPVARNVDDCVIRAVSKALNITWEEAFARLSFAGYQMGDLQNSSVVYGSVLRQNGFKRAIIPNTCPDCYTAKDFCIDNPNGVYFLSFGAHVATVVDGLLYDSVNTEYEIPIYCWYNGDPPKEVEDGSAK